LLHREASAHARGGPQRLFRQHDPRCRLCERSRRSRATSLGEDR
jgi:hypothetical protein